MSAVSPQPQARTLSGHAYVSVRQVLELFVARGSESDCISVASLAPFDSVPASKVDSYSKSLDAQRMKQDAINRIGDAALSSVIFPIIPWSDDFQLTSNQKSVWVMTVTICPPPGKGTSPNYTFPIALGKKGSDHLPVIREFFHEMAELRSMNMMYSSEEKPSVSVIADIAVYLGDRPERASFTETLSYSSNLARSSFSTSLPNLNFLPS